MDKTKIFIIITAYNVAESIEEVVKDLKQKEYKNIVVVEDGSRDNSLEVISKIPDIIVLPHIINRGQGAALQTGQEYSIKHGAKYIVHFDGDGQHDSEQIEKAVRILEENNLEMCIGTRFGKEAERVNMPFKKVLLLKLGIIFTWFVSGIVLTDTHNGFRVLTADAAKKIVITMDRFEHASEILDYLKLNKIKYKEIPVKISYTEYSKMRGQKIWNSINIMFNTLLKKFNDILLS